MDPNLIDNGDQNKVGLHHNTKYTSKTLKSQPSNFISCLFHNLCFPKVFLLKNWKNQCSITSSIFPILYDARSRQLIMENRKKNSSTLFLYNAMQSLNNDVNWLQKLAGSLDPRLGDLDYQWDAGEMLQGTHII